MHKVVETGMEEKEEEEECKYPPFVIGYTSALGALWVFAFSSCPLLELK
jgi:hypothetical protein